MKKRIYVIAASILGMATICAVGAQGGTFFKGIGVECEHAGNHYSEKKAGLKAGTKEYWVCCKCHNHYLTNPGVGSWTDAGKAGSVDKTDDRYVAKFWNVEQATDITVSDVEGGIKATGPNVDKKRIATNDKVLLDGLSFTYSWDGLIDANIDYIGFYFHNGTKCYRYITEGDTKIGPFVSFMFHTKYSGSVRMSATQSTSFAYHTTPVVYSSTTVESPDGMSNQEGHLMYNFQSKDSVKFTFNKVDSTWYKITIENTNIMSTYNYNVDGNKTTTYVKAADMGVGEDGKAYFCTLGKAGTAASTPVITILGLN